MDDPQAARRGACGPREEVRVSAGLIIRAEIHDCSPLACPLLGDPRRARNGGLYVCRSGSMYQRRGIVRARWVQKREGRGNIDADLWYEAVDQMVDAVRPRHSILELAIVMAAWTVINSSLVLLGPIVAGSSTYWLAQVAIGVTVLGALHVRERWTRKQRAGLRSPR